MHSLNSDFFDSPPPRVIAHRGGAGLNPENTATAFRTAADLGIPYAELDIRLTRDRVVVVCHDPNLARTCGRSAVIAEMDYAELASADAGWTFTRDDGASFPMRGRGLRIPRLDEILAACPETRFIIEIKQTEPSVVPAMVAIIEALAMSRKVLIASEHQAPLSEIRALRPEIPTSFSALEIARFFAAINSAADDYSPPADALQIPPRHGTMELATPQSVAAAHRMGLEVHVWTVNDEAEMRALLAMGVDGILSDFPDRLSRVIHS
ncbi:MAG: glycerophosphodiester phosphodiesterase [Candidatus Binataceae bacterium]|nr:glycerophosphodiester phosphodiesterase [Candidatus Binataceae bacterium]